MPPMEVSQFPCSSKTYGSSGARNSYDDNALTSHVYYPKTKKERINFINPKTGKIVTEFQYKIPEGYVSTYKLLSNALKSSPRAVGGALRVNPFAPMPVPCHRVIASNFFIGGFDGEWFDKKQFDNDGDDKISHKRRLLENEQISFDDSGWLIEWQKTKCLFTDFSSPTDVS
ncbi:16003_t:CDS:2 [Acaulospora morrowiae]|uniref:Methylated-DNA--protein-cysteine methyltransferase n=1 Tax=Acaulospora morrowiae TaxID=94023 RepID=A0A9N8YQR4_9GLOM|nr:16003_t:CDS:2 [Acaulospora morrowiae]